MFPLSERGRLPDSGRAPDRALAASFPEDRWTAWDRFLEATNAGFMQASWWADFRVTVGYTHFAIILRAGGGIVGGALVQKLVHRSGSAFYYIQDGPVLPEEPALAADVFESTMEAVDEHRRRDTATISHLRIEPRWETRPFPLSGFEAPARKDPYVEPRNTLYVDLRPSPASILARMKPKGRYNIAVARRHGVRVVEDASPGGLADFQRIYEDTAGRQGFRRKPPDYFEALLALAAPGRRGSVFFAEHEGLRLAAALVMHFGGRTTYFYGGSLAERRHVMAPCLLHFEIMCRARMLGYACYDLWGVAPEGEPHDPWTGISAFKRRFGGREVRLVPTLDRVYDRAAYDQYVRGAQAAGLLG